MSFGRDRIMNLVNFFKKGFLLFLFFAIFLTISTLFGMSHEAVKAGWFGLGLAVLNFVAGVTILSWGATKSDRKFYSVFLGGMLARFAMLFILLFVLIKIFQVQQIVLLISLLITYFSFLAIEIWIIYQSSQTRGG
jgi:hypothetical protein